MNSFFYRTIFEFQKKLLFQLATFISSEIIQWPRDTQILASGCAQCQEKWEKEEINVKVKPDSGSLWIFRECARCSCASIAFLHYLHIYSNTNNQSYYSLTEEFWRVENWVHTIQWQCIIWRIVSLLVPIISEHYLSQLTAFICLKYYRVSNNDILLNR